jgi:hypothetical protein
MSVSTCQPQPKCMNANNHKSPPPSAQTADEPHQSAPAAHEAIGDAGEWKRIKQQAGEVIDFLSYYLEARVDILKLRGRRFLLHLLLEIDGVLVVAGTLVVAITLIFIGVAQGLSQVFAGMPWLGPLITGLALLGIVSLVVWWWVADRSKVAHNRMVEKYEHRKSHQRARFGHDVGSHAEEAAPTEQRTGVSDPSSR